MLIVRFRGGLGNQMFTTAFCKWLEQYRDDIRADITEYTRAQIHDGFEIEKIFEQRFEYATNAQIRKMSPYRPLGVLPGSLGLRVENRWQDVAFSKRDSYKSLRDEEYFNARTVEEQIEILSKADDDYYLDGGWGRTRYWQCDRLDEIFRFKSNLTKAYAEDTARMENEESCSLHIRRGDFVGSKYDICDTAYYEKAIDIIKARCDNPVFYVFTDDPNGAREILEPIMAGSTMIFPHNKGITGAGDDLLLMTACRYHIDSTSTYAFWGSVLGHRKGNVIVAPDIWRDSLPDVVPSEDIVWMDTGIE